MGLPFLVDIIAHSNNSDSTDYNIPDCIVALLLLVVSLLD
jgi:hypothetical protein